MDIISKRGSQGVRFSLADIDAFRLTAECAKLRDQVNEIKDENLFDSLQCLLASSSDNRALP